MHTKTSQQKSYKAILLIAFPIIVQGMVFQAQTLINRAFLGNLKTEYLSAIGNTSFPYMASLSMLTAISMGLTILISRYTGAKDYKTAQNYMNTSIIFNSLFSIGLFAIWYFLSDVIFRLMGVTPELIDYCDEYVKIISLYLFVFGADISVQATLQGVGKTRPIMFAGLYKVIMNIFLDWCLIFGNFGLPALGLIGAAIASVISNISSAVLLILYAAFSKQLPVKIGIRSLLHPCFANYKKVMALGLPAGFENFAWQIGNILLVRLLNGFSITAVGMYTVIVGIENVSYLFSDGLGRGGLTLAGHKIGENDTGGAMKIINRCFKYDIVAMSALILTYIIFAKQILNIFTNDIPLINSSILYFIIISIAILPKSINVMSGSGIRAFGDTKWMLYTQLIGTVFVICISYFFVYVLHMSVLAIYVTLLMDETLRAVLNTHHLYKGNLVSSPVFTGENAKAS